MRAELVVQSGALQGRRFQLVPDRPFSVGRSANVDLLIDDPKVSRSHCRLEYGSGAWKVVDPGSSNGTFLNGKRVGAAPLCSGDVLEIGGCQVRYQTIVIPVDKSPSGATVHWVAEDSRPGGQTIRRRFEDKEDVLLPMLQVPQSAGDTRRNLQLQLETIYGLSNIIHAESNLDAIFELAIDAIFKVGRATRSAILMADEATSELQTKAIRVAKDTGESTFCVSRTIVDETLRQGLSLLATDAQTDSRFQVVHSIRQQGIESVMCVPVRAGGTSTGVIYVDNTSLISFNEDDLRLLAAIGQQLGVAVERARLLEDLQQLFVGVIHTLVATIEAKDPYTKGHSERVTRYALVIAQELGCTPAECVVVELAGLLHDVGKIGVSESVLNKQSRLDDAEREHVQVHPVVGADIIRNIHNIDRLLSMDAIVAGVRHHHEKYDGTGYPDGLARDAIPLAARILSIADTYDAITSDRPYRKGGPKARAIQEISGCAGSQFDPAGVKAFEAVMASGKFEAAGSSVSQFKLRPGQQLVATKSTPPRPPARTDADPSELTDHGIR